MRCFICYFQRTGIIFSFILEDVSYTKARIGPLFRALFLVGNSTQKNKIGCWENLICKQRVFGVK